MKRGKKLLLIVALLCLTVAIYLNVTGEKKRIRTPEDGTDSEFYLYFGEEDAERIDKITLRKRYFEPDYAESYSEIEITNQDIIQEIAGQILALKLTEDENIDTKGIRENKIKISFNTGGPDLNLYVGSDNRLLRDMIVCSTDTKVIVNHEVFIMEPEIDFEQLWEMAEIEENQRRDNENVEQATKESIDPTEKDTNEASKEEIPSHAPEVEETGIREETVDRIILGSELSERYMCRADFTRFNLKELRLIRNGIYARNGAIFQSEDLNTYFGAKAWYQGEIPIEEFPEELISNVERANLDLIKDIEEVDKKNGAEWKSLDSLPEAPYLPYLDQYSETGIEADMKVAEDMGLYYVVPGTIKHPVVFTEEQRLAMENGGETEIVVNEVNGETKMLRKFPGSEPNTNVYLWYEKGTEPNTDTEVVNAWFDMESGVHTLWHFSDDTIMKNVYEGNLFILKGAGTGAHLSLELASADQREITIPDQNAEPWEATVFGNYLFHDGKGYFTAVYYLGD